MADTKISGLPASTTPLAGTEVLPIVQSSSTVQVSVANLTAGRAVATGALTVTGTLGTTDDITVTKGSAINLTLNNTAGVPFTLNNNAAGELNIIRSNVNTIATFTSAGLAVTGALSATGTLSGGTSGTAYSFSGSAPATSLTLNSSGNLGIGTASPAVKLDVYGAIRATYDADPTYYGTFNNAAGAVQLYANGDSAPLLFGTTSVGGSTATERARIDASGFFKARANGGAYFGGNSNQILNNNNVSGDVCLLIGNAAGNATNNTSSYSFIAADASGDRLYIYGNGNVVNINNSYGTLSDVKLKENIVDATPKLDDVMRLQVRNFNLKSNPELKQIGFVAQELEQIFPALIDESPDRDAEGNITEEMTKSIKTSVLVPILVKAMQEQQALITQLTARITALETA